MQAAIASILHLVNELGYAGIFLLALIESTFVPLPAEMSMLPAGVLVAQGKMHYGLVLFFSTSGVVMGSLINYWLGMSFGRGFILRFGKYFLLKPSSLDKVELFFQKHGIFATLAGRLIPGIRHYIAFPAGMARMPMKPFLLCTTLGGGAWMWILLHIGYLTGLKSADGEISLHSLEEGTIILAVVVITMYLIKLRFFK